jgi:hypothetical protein
MVNFFGTSARRQFIKHAIHILMPIGSAKGFASSMASLMMMILAMGRFRA